MSNHTPGPWNWDKFGSEYQELWSENNGPVIDFEKSDYPYSDFKLNITDANALLIASAPELLESLKNAVTFIENMEDVFGHNDASMCFVDSARAVIAKAVQES
jgi:hypothetical protein